MKRRFIVDIDWPTTTIDVVRDCAFLESLLRVDPETKSATVIEVWTQEQLDAAKDSARKLDDYLGWSKPEGM